MYPVWYPARSSVCLPPIACSRETITELRGDTNMDPFDDENESDNTDEIESDNESTNHHDAWLEEIRSKLECDDDWLTRLFIDKYGSKYQPPDGDWERDGAAIGMNTHLQLLGVYTYPSTNVDMLKFFSGAASNKSIINLYFRGCDLYNGFIFSTLLPIFDRRPNKLQYLSVINCSMESGTINMLAYVLTRFNTLKRFEYCCNRKCPGDDTRVEKALQALSEIMHI